MSEKHSKQLTLYVLPDRTLVPEWEEARTEVSDETALEQADIYSLFQADPETWLFYTGFRTSAGQLTSGVDFFTGFAGLFVSKLTRIPELESLRHKAGVILEQHELDDFVQSVPMITGAEYVDQGMLLELWKGFQDTFSDRIRSYDGTLASFFHEHNPRIHLAGRVFFHLVESRKNESPFAFMATYSDGSGPDNTPKHLPLKHAVQKFDDNQLYDLLSTVYRAAEKSELVSSLIDSGELFHPLHWDRHEAFKFLKEIPVYEESGVLCRIPDWWKPASKSTRVNISLGAAEPALVGMDALLDFNAEVLLGDVAISKEQARQMLEESEGLAFIKNRWVRVDHEKLEQAIQACETAERMAESGITFREAMQMQLNPDKALATRSGSSGGVELGVSNGAWLESVIRKLKQQEKINHIKPGKDFKAELRPYQEKGMSWLYFLDSFSFGACLADDMGLGKTIQVLAFLSALRKEKKLEAASLLVVPASLISNWIAEIERFFPGLKVYPAHPGFADPLRKKQAGMVRSQKTDAVDTGFPDGYDLVITSYALVHRYEWLAGYHWRYLILDEAQAIKNPAAKQTRAVKNLQSKNRIIMTGTPVENRVSDLWSLFDFLNPGLLGNKAEFSRFAKTLRSDSSGYARLRKIVSPYILRRLKTDKSVAPDLPDKVEMKSYADLTGKQIVLYNKAVSDLEKQIAESEGIRRKGLVLSSLMKFKQLCNHPDQLTGTGEFRETQSGKFQRLRRICETVLEKRERVLVFTQFKEMTSPLQAFLESVFHHPGLVLHGSIPAARRKKIIDKFQGESWCPFMVLSLKAGGVGLNLTKANHVVHFDRWWNPAVENQATDRAFRIGQEKKVLVHKFVTKGTIEERIDEMLEGKKDMAGRIVEASGENMVTEMDDAQLMDLFRLRLEKEK
ncbi:MAG: DEAD/DEAH box helicase [Desulfobacteraceae bacterium]